MKSDKKRVLELIQALPEDATLGNILYYLKYIKHNWQELKAKAPPNPEEVAKVQKICAAFSKAELIAISRHLGIDILDTENDYKSTIVLRILESGYGLRETRSAKQILE